MAQFDFMATWGDDWQFISDLLAYMNCSIIVDKWYDVPAFEIHKLLTEDVKATLMQRRRMYLLFDGKHVDSGDGLVLQKGGERDGWYRIDATFISDVVEVVLPPCFEKEGQQYLGPGSVALFRKYFSIKSQTWNPPTQSAKAFFKAICGRMKQNLRRLHLNHSAVWFGMEAISLFASGNAFVMYEGKVYTTEEGAVKQIRSDTG